MSHRAQEIYFDRHRARRDAAGIERVTAADVQRVAIDLFKNGSLAATGRATSTDCSFRANASISTRNDSTLYAP
jgi:hypothetical protein